MTVSKFKPNTLTKLSNKIQGVFLFKVLIQHITLK